MTITRTTVPVESRPGQGGGPVAPKRRMLALGGTRLFSWKTVLFQSLGRELHALHSQQQERAFMATTHGLAYTAWQNETTLH